jgi:uncharacterized protein YneF (UPF0154 family)
VEIITTTAIATFLGVCLSKAGEKFSEKAIETVFENKKDIADGFMGLFKEEIITLGLNDSSTPADIENQLEAKPEVAVQALKKLSENPELVADLNRHLKEQFGGMTISAEKIGQVVQKMEGTNTQNISF